MYKSIFLRTKIFDENFLLHSEWQSKLRAPFIFAFALVLGMALGMFVIIPSNADGFAGASSIVSFFIAATVIIISVLHVNELLCMVPKSCLLYHLTYESFGELAAFLTASISFVDFARILAVIVKSWSYHVRMLFNGNLRVYLDQKHALLAKNFTRTCDITVHNKIFEDVIDEYAVFAIICVTIILCFDLQVAGTIAFMMLSVSAIASSSTILVGFFNANPNFWLTRDTFQYGIYGVIRATSYLMLLYTGIEAITFFLEEINNPKKKLPFIFSFLTILILILAFICLVIINLSTDLKIFKCYRLLSSIFNYADMPAAGYFLTIGAFFSLTGAAMTAFIPTTRILASLSLDGLLSPIFASNINRTSVISNFSLATAGLFSIPFVFIRTSNLIDTIALNVSIRILLASSIVYIKRCYSETIGTNSIEKTKYKRWNKNSCTKCCNEDYDTINSHRHCECEDNDDESADSDSEHFLMYQLRTQSGNLLNESTVKSGNSSEFGEAIRVVSVEITPNFEWTNEHYSLADDKKDSHDRCANNADRKIHRASKSSNNAHNCVQSACSANFPTDRGCTLGHLYQYDIPEFPYCVAGKKALCNEADSACPFETASILLRFIALSSIGSILLLISSEIDSKVLSTLLVVSILFLIISFIVYVSWQFKRKKNIERRCKTPLFPYLTFLSMFITILSILSTPVQAIIESIVWIVIGCVIYRCYGYQYSKRRFHSNHDRLLYKEINGTNSQGETAPLLNT